MRDVATPWMTRSRAEVGEPPELRRLCWPDCRNVRDLGGLPTSSGARTRYGVLIRADCLDRLGSVGKAAVEADKVERIIDLRSSWELRPDEPHPFRDSPIHRSVPFIDERRDGERDRTTEHTRADLYRGSLDRNGKQIAIAVGAVASSAEGAVVVHCRSGVDRTGMLVALILDVVGVRRTAIAYDYALSEHELEASASRLPASAGTIIELLEHADLTYGGTRSYLKRHGVTDEQLATLRERLVSANRLT